MSFLRLKNVYVKIGNFELNNINLAINRGEFMSVMGTNGSGKTVLLESIAGLHKVEGEIWLDNVNITNLPPQQRKIGIVYQDYMLFPNMTVRKNILYPTLFNKESDTEDLFSDIISFFGISSILDRSVKNLSGGEKQKVAIARALLSKPRLLLLDEPLNAVDFTFKSSFMEFLMNIHKKYALTVLYVTHNLKEAIFFSNRAAVLLDGKICQDSETDLLFGKPKNRKVAEFLGFKNILHSGMLGIDSHAFFSVNPNDIKISYNQIDNDFVFKATVLSALSIKNGHRIKAAIGKELLHINSTKPFKEGSYVYISFDKKDISLFD